MSHSVRMRLVSCIMVLGLLAGGMAAISPTMHAAGVQGGQDAPNVTPCQYWHWGQIASASNSGYGDSVQAILYGEFDNYSQAYCGRMYAWAKGITCVNCNPAGLIVYLDWGTNNVPSNPITINTNSSGTVQTVSTAVPGGTSASANAVLSPCGSCKNVTATASGEG